MSTIVRLVSPIDPEEESLEVETILEAMENGEVFKVAVRDDDRIWIIELCENFHAVELTRAQLAQLGRELLALAESPAKLA